MGGLKSRRILTIIIFIKKHKNSNLKKIKNI